MLGCGIQLHHRTRNLLNAAALLFRCRGDLSHNVIHPGDRVHHLLHGLPGFRHQVATGGNARDRFADQQFNILRRLRATLRKAAHFARHNGKAAPLLTRAGGLDGGVQRQDIGLEGDTVNHRGDIGNFLRTGIDVAHGTNHILHHASALGSSLRGFCRQLTGMTGVVGVVFYRGGELFHTGGGLDDGSCLLLGTGREIGVALGDFGSRQRHLRHAAAYFANHGAQFLVHPAHRSGQFTQLVFTLRMDFGAEVAAGNPFRQLQVVFHRMGDLAGDPPGDDDPEQNRHHANNGGDGTGAVSQRIVVLFHQGDNGAQRGATVIPCGFDVIFCRFQRGNSCRVVLVSGIRRHGGLHFAYATAKTGQVPRHIIDNRLLLRGPLQLLRFGG